MKNKNNISLLILAFIFIAGLFLRVYRLNLNLPPLYADETGQYFTLHSLNQQSSNITQNLVNSIISFSWLLGLSTLGIRLPSAIFGSLVILFGYFFAKVVTKSSQSNLYLRVALVYALLLAAVPWNYMISRIGHTHVPIVVFLALVHLITFLRSKSIKEYLISLIPLGIAVIFYPSVIFIFPFILVHMLVLIIKIVDKKFRLALVALLLFGSIIFGGYVSIRFRFFRTTGRGLDLAIWRDINTPWQIDKYRALSWNSEPTLFSFGLPSEQLANKLVYNRVMANITTFAHNYFSFFSPDWLFFRGDAILRHSTGQVGAFYPFLIPFMLYGAFVFFNTADKKTRWTFLIWIIASPIPAAITKDGAGYLLRVVTMLPFLTFFCARGLVESFNLIKKNWRIPYGILIAMLGIYSAYYFFYGYFHVYPALSARSYEYGFKELSDFQASNKNAVMLVVWDGYYHNNDFRFWQATPFDQYEAFKINEIVVGESHFWQTFPNLYFVNPKSEKDLLAFLKQTPVSFVVLPDRYFVSYPLELDEDFATPSAVIKYPDQTPALRIYSVR